MALELVQPRIRGFICTNAHPDGCRENVRRQVAVTRSLGTLPLPMNVVVIGASTGYGLATRIACAFGYDAKTFGVFFERPPDGSRTASAGYYNSAAFHAAARETGLYAKSLNGDAFSDAVKTETLETVARDMGKVDLLVYSLASPRRTHPRTGVTHNSVLKPIGSAYTTKSLDLNTGEVTQVTLEAATSTDIADTVAVMGGEDWEMWVRAFDDADLLADGARTVAFSYIGPELTHAIYRHGTIGKAKEHLESTANALDERLRNRGGGAYVSVNKAVVTQASAAIPVVPLYLSILYPVMQANGIHEDPIHQMNRLIREHLNPRRSPTVDDDRRIRLDDRELRPDIQAEVIRRWQDVSTENLPEFADVEGFQREFRRLFGFDVPVINYEQATEIHVALD
jgi:enoyl-[acyl-carrier protein] reductase/trans-2-enoyl-CoA reductase (NAD+)